MKNIYLEMLTELHVLITPDWYAVLVSVCLSACLHVRIVTCPGFHDE
jgi:hypothetical protein